MIFTSGRFSFLAISGRTRTIAPPPSLMTQQSSRWIGDQWRVEYVLDRDHLRQHGVRIVLGVMGGGNFHPGELLGRGAVLIHMAHSAHRIAVDGSDGVGRFPRSFRLVRIARTRRGTGRHAIAARPARERDQRHVAFAQCDRFSRVCGQRDVGGAADLSRIHVAKLQIHILRHRGGSGPRRIAGAEIAVNVLTRQPGVGQGTEGHFGVELRDGLIRRQPRRMLENTGDIGLALNGHPASFPLPATYR
jgi:hypothetical protein